jgi:predicted nucleic acid-binding protein
MPKQSVIVDTSPLQYLHQVNCLDLLQKLYSKITVPSAVCEELQVGLLQGVDVPAISLIKWIQVVQISSPALVPNVTDLGQGEAEVIALGIQSPESLLILDDSLGRRIADLYQLKYTGTLGVLIKAKKLGHLDEIAPVIDQLRTQGMWLTDKIIGDILRLAGE